MATDLYAVLGVPRDADEDTIKGAFRKLAAKYHPDRAPGAANEARFKEINGAHTVLSDPAKRALYDEFGEEGLVLDFDPEAAREARRRWEQGPDPDLDPDPEPAPEPAPARKPKPRGGVRFEDPGTFDLDLTGLLERLFDRGKGKKAAGPKVTGPVRGKDLEVTTTIDLASALRGTVVKLFRGEEQLAVRLPPFVTNGRRLRVKGRGGKGKGGGEDGDLVLVVRVGEG